MAALPTTISSQQPVDLGGGFEDPMDPCTMCMQGQQEIQQAYNELTQSCNACQTQQNLTNLQQQGCQGCAQAQQVIQKVQQQSTGCASCGQQPTTFQQMMPQLSSQQPMLQSQLNTGLLPQTFQGLVQPMLTPLVGTQQNILTTVGQQPGMVAGQLPISIERGVTSQTTPQTAQQFVNGQLMNVPVTTQPMVTGMVTPPMPMQPVVTGMVTSPPTIPMQPVVTPNIPAAPVMQPVMQPAPPQPPVQQPVMQPAPPPPMAPIAQPMIQTPNLTPAQVAGVQSYVQNLFPGGVPNISIVAAGPSQAASGSGKAGPGAAGGIFLGPEGQLSYGFNIAAGPGIGSTAVSGLVGGGIGAPGAFDVHRPDLHAGGGWHMTLPMGTEGLLNLY